MDNSASSAKGTTGHPRGFGGQPSGGRRDRAEHVPQCAYSAVSDHRTLARIGAQKSRYFLRNNAPKVVYFVKPVLSILCARHVPGL
jgi:hypothetical protein